MLLNPDVKDPTSYLGKKFRRRFRVPYKLFNDVIVPQCKQANVFEEKPNSTIPTELRVLVALRILGRDSTGDECEELSFIGETTARDIFVKFVTNYTFSFYSYYVRLPTGNMLNDVMETYRCGTI
jgi:hypothetical protein